MACCSAPENALLIAITLPVTWNGDRHGSVFADKKKESACG